MSIIENLQGPFISALSWSIIHSLWQVAIIALVWRVLLYFTRNAQARFRYHLSMAAFLAVPLFFLLTFFKQYAAYSQAQPIAFLEFETSQWVNMQAAAAWYLIPKDNPGVLQFFENYTREVFAFYILGLLFTSAYYSLAFRKNFLLKKRHLAPCPEAWKPVIEKTGNALKFKSTSFVFISTKVSVPVVVGFFKPVVLFPAAVAGSLTLEEVENILLHEFYHIKCLDHYLNLGQSILELLFFYHPLVWWISAVIRRERESRVDEWVVSYTRKASSYAQTLVRLEENRKENWQKALAATSSKSTLFIRIKNIMHMKTRNIKPGQKLAALLVAALSVISLAWLSPSHKYTIHNNYEELPLQADWVETPAYTDQAPERQEPAQSQSEPRRIVLENGKAVDWEQLSEQDKEEVKKAIHEARIAIQQANEEVFAMLHSEEFRQQMQGVNQEIRQAMAEIDKEVFSAINSEEFRRDMQKAREEIKKAMTEINSEEFQEEMRKAREEIREAMEKINSEEFRQEMNNAGVELREAMKEINMMLEGEEFQQQMQQMSVQLQEMFNNLNEIPWEDFGNQMQKLFEEMGKSYEYPDPQSPAEEK